MKKYVLSEFIKRHWKTLMPFMSPLKAVNISRAMLDYKLRSVKCSSKPFVFRVDPCSLCNLKCPTCNTHTAETKEKRIMDFEDFKIILGRLKSVAIRFSLYDMGEPLMHKNIYDMIKLLTQNKISSLISTNFNLFKEEDVDRLFDSGLTVLSPCLDGFTQESYSAYRAGGDVDIVKNGIRAVMERKHKTKSKYPYVDVNVVEFDHIKEELDDIDAFLKKCGVDKITYRQENLGFNSDETTFKPEENENTCFWLYLGMMIRPDGSVYPCCGRDFDRFAYGNILEESLDEIWNNKYYRFSRELYKKGGVLEITEDLKEIPCITCDLYKKQRKLTKAK